MAETNTSGKILDQAKGLLSRTIEADVRLLNRFSKLAADAARQASARTKDRSFPSLTEGATRFAEWSLACWTAAAEHGVAFAQELAKVTERALDLEASTPETTKSPVEIGISAHPGSEARAAFQVDNALDTPVSMTFEASEPVDPKGIVVGGASVRLEPDRLELAAKGQGLVQAIVQLPADVSVGSECLVGLKPIGCPAREIRIRVQVTAPPSGQTTGVVEPKPVTGVATQGRRRSASK